MDTLKFVVTTAAVGVAALLAGGQQASAQVRIGSVLSVTGPASFLGDPEKKTLEMYVEEINAKGGVNGQKLQLTVYDDGGDANNARTFATRLAPNEPFMIRPTPRDSPHPRPAEKNAAASAPNCSTARAAGPSPSSRRAETP